MATVENTTETTTENDTGLTNEPPRDFGAEIRANTVAVRLGTTKLRTTKAFNSAQRAVSAEAFDADSNAVRGSKRIFNNAAEELRAITRLQNHCKRYVEGMTIDHPQKGIRLVRRDKVEELNREVGSFQEQLEVLITEANDAYQGMRTERQEALASLFNEADYPMTLLGEWSISLKFPSLEPNTSMLALHPEIYEAEKRRVAAEFDAVVGNTTAAFEVEFERLLGSLVEAMTGTKTKDGETVRKSFHTSSVANLGDFFDTFQALDIGNNEELQRLIGQANQVVKGIDVENLRQSDELRDRVAEQMTDLREELVGPMVDRPSRMILIDEDEE